jgi:hypothetical protein
MCNLNGNCQLYVCNFMKSGLFVATAIFVTIYITILDIVWKCCCQIVNGTLPYCHADVCHIRCHRITLLHTSLEMCGQAHIKYICACVCHMHMLFLCVSNPWWQYRPLLYVGSFNCLGTLSRSWLKYTLPVRVKRYLHSY